MSSSVSFAMGDRISMSISGDSLSDETLNRGPLALLLMRQYEFPSGIDIVQFSFFFEFSSFYQKLFTYFQFKASNNVSGIVH